MDPEPSKTAHRTARAVATSALLALVAAGCDKNPKNSATATGAGGAGLSSGATTGAGKPDLLPICKNFCNAYQHCAPIADCLNGCLVSPFVGCENEYVADVVCITGALQGCSVPADQCNNEASAYMGCQMTTSASTSTGSSTSTSSSTSTGSATSTTSSSSTGG